LTAFAAEKNESFCFAFFSKPRARVAGEPGGLKGGGLLVGWRMYKILGCNSFPMDDGRCFWYNFRIFIAGLYLSLKNLAS
jgi:hypothetical protein